MSIINPAIFRSYDIRGNSHNDITNEIASKIGFCFSKMNITADNNLICVGRDGRISSPLLFKSLISGLLVGNAKVLSIGLVPTPTLYYADKKLKPAASIMITGSHNKKDDNGFKMVVNGQSFFGQQIQDLLKLINSTNWNDIKFVEQNVEEYNIANEYIDRILQDIRINDDLKIAWDPGNGAACNIMQILQTKLPNKNILINSEIDGNFPNHHPDPTVPENLKQLIEIVKSEQCDAGIAFDGDADRIGIITASGKILWGDQILCLFVKDILQNNFGATIIADVKASQVVFDQVKKYGGNSIMWKTGHSFIKNKMQQSGALLAGEMSGHIFFADKYYGYDDAIYAALRFLELISNANNSLDKLLVDIPEIYNTPEIRIDTHDSLKFQIIDEIKAKLIEDKAEFNDIDGLRVNTKDGWWLLRASNTQGAIIARCESSSKLGLNELITNLKQLLSKYNLKLIP